MEPSNAYFAACQEILQHLITYGERTDLTTLKTRVAARYHLPKIPTNAELLALAPPEHRERLRRLLLKHPTRSASGVVPVAVMSKPIPCPKPRPCAYCPGGPSWGTPQSYTGEEPACLRGIQTAYDPYQQVRHRIAQLESAGHVCDKVELIIMGGTFPAAPRDYQEWFIKGCFEALAGRRFTSFEEAKRAAEHAPYRVVALTFETRPDQCTPDQVKYMLYLGATRVEIGVQSIYDDVLELVERGHGVDTTIEATRILKDYGLKLCYHIMPFLPGSSFERDLQMFHTLFDDPRFRPDMLKIYPTLVIPGTRLYQWWREGKYPGYTDQDAIELLVRVKPTIPPWVRILRVQRDIPARVIAAGVKKSNLRQLVHRELRRRGLRCRCIRCREVERTEWKSPLHPQLVIRRYEASEGIEVFLSVEDVKQDVIIGILRLRIPSEHADWQFLGGPHTAIIRELHVYGFPAPLHAHKDPHAWQHRGIGKQLMTTAEKIAHEDYDAKRIIVTSGIGVRQYYHRLGYHLQEPYMAKQLH